MPLTIKAQLLYARIQWRYQWQRYLEGNRRTWRALISS